MATTIKVPEELRDRLAVIARRDHTTLAGAIDRALARAEEADFWRQVAERMPAREGAPLADQVAGTLTDGLDPDERWDDLW